MFIFTTLRDFFRLLKKLDKGSSKFFQNYWKNKRLPEILSNYFKYKTRSFQDYFKQLQKSDRRSAWDSFELLKNKTHGVNLFFKLLQKQDTESERFFQTTSKTRHKGSSRFFQITSKRKQQIPRFKNNTRKAKQGSIKNITKRTIDSEVL